MIEVLPTAPPAPEATPLAPTGAIDPAALGAHLVGDGLDVVVTAGHVQAVVLCLVDVGPDGARTERRLRLHGPERGRWHGHVPGVRAGQRYGLRVHGPWRPEHGLRHNPAKLLLDPYARAVDGPASLSPLLYPHVVDESLRPVRLEPDPRDSLPDVALGVVVAAPDADEAAARPPGPRVPAAQRVVYEAHVKGLTALHPDVPPALRGTYAGLAHPAVLRHLTDLGVTTVELLPIHAIMAEPVLAGRGLPNYWGYSTLSYFAPEPSYATAASRAAGPEAVLAEVRAMIDALHGAGLEVVLDVVYNHSAEGGENGPSVSLRGLDARGYYLHDPSDPSRFLDVTGCGNSLDFRMLQTVRLTLDSLRHWVTDIGVDGFRFDLAVTLGRNGDDFSTHHPLFVAMATDPVLSRALLIAEPWDLGPAGWRTGQFPAEFAEWNDRFRDTVRSFWLSDARANSQGRPGHDLRDLATRLSGSGDLFGHSDRPGERGGTLSSINFVTAHDGFTLADLVTYDDKHNEANGEGNRDGSSDNRSWNHGIEGDVPPGPEFADVPVRRHRSVRNLLGTLAVAAGVPMLTAGDELGRSQGGNNNAYCQDNEISWTHWDLAQWQRDLAETTSYLLTLRRENPVLRPQALATGAAAPGDAIPDLGWGDVDGLPIPVDAWHDPSHRVLQMLRSGGADGPDLLVVLNGSITGRDVTLMTGRATPWQLRWDSAWETPRESDGSQHAPGSAQSMAALSMRIYLT